MNCTALQIDEEQMHKILALIETGKKQGATLQVGGNRVGDKGYFIEPTVFSNVKDDMTIATTEVNIFITFNSDL